MTKEEKQKESADAFLLEALNEARERGSEKSVKTLEALVPKQTTQQKPIKQNAVVEDEYVPEIEEYENGGEYEGDFEESYEVGYDKVSLPSAGKIYGKSFKTSKISVAYLTGSDEDIISNPGIYTETVDGESQLFDVLLRRKILDKNIRPELLCNADRDAIIVWLRATSYGNYPISTLDPDTGERFDTEIDLSQIKPKPFILEPNENGYFEFTLPNSKDEIEFRFLVHKDELDYNKLLKKTNNKLKKHALNSAKELLVEMIGEDESIEKLSKTKLDNALKVIGDYVGTIEDTDDYLNAKGITFRLEKSIISINGEKNRKFIHDYVKNMRVYDSLSLRRHIVQSMPVLNFEIEITRPDNTTSSLGGGSTFTTFLTIDESIFLNYK